LAKHRSTFDRYNIVSPTEKLEAARKLAAFSEVNRPGFLGGSTV